MTDERRRAPLPVPVGELLVDAREGALGADPKAREDELWARIAARRGRERGRLAVLPVPVSTALLRANDEAAARARHWRAVNVRRALAREGRLGAGTKLALASGLSAVAALLLVLLWRGPVVVVVDAKHPSAPPAEPLTLASGAPLEPVDAAQGSVELVLTDASRIRLAPGARVVPLASTESRLDVLLERGSADFSVTPGGPRRWTIAAGPVRVEVVGTEFRVSRAHDRVDVQVSHGIVLVSGPGVPNGVQRLTAGQNLHVASRPSVDEPPTSEQPPIEQTPTEQTPTAQTAVPHTELPTAQRDPDEVRAPAPRHLPTKRASIKSDQPDPKRRPAPPPPPDPAPLPPTPIPVPQESGSSWRRELKAAQYVAAYEALTEPGLVRVAERSQSPQELVDLADVARLSGHPREALAPLKRLRDVFPRSPEAPLAAFMLGRILLDQLGEPDAAAAAFERAIAMPQPRARLEDGYALLVQAYARTGEYAKARRTAAIYRERFRRGRHLAEIARWLSP